MGAMLFRMPQGEHRGHGPLLQKPLVSIAGMARSYKAAGDAL